MSHNTDLRDMFAANALQGLAAAGGEYDVRAVAEMAYCFADAMLAERLEDRPRRPDGYTDLSAPA